MPRKSAVNKPIQTGTNKMPDFVNCNLTDDQKDFVKANVLPLKELFDQLDDLVADNYKITMSYDDQTDCYSVFMIGKDNQTINNGLMLSAYAPILSGALSLLLFKHFTVLKEDWVKHTQGNNPASWR